jgi:hypothetical protein
VPNLDVPPEQLVLLRDVHRFLAGLLLCRSERLGP